MSLIKLAIGLAWVGCVATTISGFFQHSELIGLGFLMAVVCTIVMLGAHFSGQGILIAAPPAVDGFEHKSLAA